MLQRSFQRNGAPRGFGQISPFHDQAQSEPDPLQDPGQDQGQGSNPALQQAIMQPPNPNPKVTYPEKGQMYDKGQSIPSVADLYRVPGTGSGIQAPQHSQPNYNQTFDFKSQLDPSKMQGSWNYDKLQDPTHNSVKYLAGRFMAQKDISDQSMNELAEYLRGQGYGVEFGGGDKMRLSGNEIRGLADIDMIQNYNGADPSARRFQWSDMNEAGPAPQQQGQGMGNYNPLQSAILNGMTQPLNAQGSGAMDLGQSSNLLEQILAALRGGN